MKLFLSLLFSVVYLFSSEAFISSEDLKQKLSNTDLVLIDTTDAKTFAKGHIPHAVQVDISKFRYWVNKTYLLMKSSKEIQELARNLGINKNSEVIIYGHNKNKELLKASYIALALIINGFENVTILNGGYGDWMYEYEDENDASTTKIFRPQHGNFKANVNKNILVDRAYVQKNIGKVPMIEARPLVYFTGEKKSNGVKRLGHITGASSSYWRDKFNLDDSLRSDEVIKNIFLKKNKLTPKKEVIAYCTGGLEASMNWYLLTQYLGFKDVKIYDASMKEWGNLEDTPMQISQP